MLTAVTGEAAAKKQRIIYIPHDNRPISFEQTISSIKGMEFEVLTPPEELLGNRTYGGDPDGLWRWLFKTTVKSFTDKDNEVEDYMPVHSDYHLYTVSCLSLLQRSSFSHRLEERHSGNISHQQYQYLLIYALPFYNSY